MFEFLVKGDKGASFSFVFDKNDDFVGCALYGTDAGELINIAALIINLKLTRTQLSQMIFTFPGSTYAFLGALMPLLKA